MRLKAHKGYFSDLTRMTSPDPPALKTRAFLATPINRVKSGGAEMMDMRTFLPTVATICITEKVLSGQGEQLDPWDPLLTAAGTPQLRAPPSMGPRTRQISAHWALGLGPSQAWRGLLRVGRQAGRLGEVRMRGLFSTGMGKIWANKWSGARLFRLEEVTFFCTFELFSQGLPLPPTQETNTETGLFQSGLQSLQAAGGKQHRGQRAGSRVSGATRASGAGSEGGRTGEGEEEVGRAGEGRMAKQETAGKYRK